ncbi:hypothetical protein I7I50_05551 [Histoplasma capsulatum G186AR]|uniref:Uncharacterized protein n=1 Tax=Ajellomyces capsulatus TaxID=5037 RepID=A0A8H8DA47_AJECA|nr:hypothetical protein I7I52_03811 [Histoplasma capsulatum]QSS76184.1 hypothetical protein I7I50_05551 [Histoplasma capsulatum G186AR]
MTGLLTSSIADDSQTNKTRPSRLLQIAARVESTHQSQYNENILGRTGLWFFFSSLVLSFFFSLEPPLSSSLPPHEG